MADNYEMRKAVEAALDEWREKNPPDPKADKPFRASAFRLKDYKPEPDFFDVEDRNTIVVYWGGYGYAVYFEDDDGPGALLRVVSQLGRKGWPLMTPRRLARFVEVVSRERGFSFYGNGEPK